MYSIYYTSIVTDSLIRTEVNRIKETKGFLVLSEIEVHPCAIKRGMKPLPSYIAAAGGSPCGSSPRRRGTVFHSVYYRSLRVGVKVKA